MKTKEVLLVLGGVAIGYYAYKMNWMRKSKIVVEEVVSEVKDVVVDTAKATKCEQEWNDTIGVSTRFASVEAREQSKKDYVQSCISK